MSGNAPLISALVAERPMCLPCLAARTSMAPEAVMTALAILERVLTIHRRPGTRCDSCGTSTTVFTSVSHP
jgi:hypothetical protein